MRAAGEEIRVEQARHVPEGHRTIGDPAQVRLDLDHWLQEIGAARTVANELRLQPARQKFGFDRPGDLVGAERQRARIGGNIDDRGHARTSSTISSSLSASSRPITSPSSIAEGAQAQSPRQ